MYICVNTFEPATGCRGWSPLPLSLWACFQLSTYEPSRSSSGVYLNCLSDTHLFFLSLGGTSQFFQRHAEIPQLKLTLESSRASLVAQTVKYLPVMLETWVQFQGWEDCLKKGMTSPSSMLAWRIPWIEEPGELQSMESQRVGWD